MLGGSLRRLVAALAVALAVLATRAVAAVVDRSFHRDFNAVWGKRNARFLEQGRVVELSLDQRTGSRLESKDRYLFGRFDLDIRLVAGESAGTITSFYVSLFRSLRFILALANCIKRLFTSRGRGYQCTTSLPSRVRHLSAVE
jgi:hypothetical protein